MEHKKLKFIEEKKQNVRFIFAGKQISSFGRKALKKDNKVHLKYAIKPSKLARKQPQNPRSLCIGVNHGLHTRAGIGLYPVPTGRILQRYAKEHDLMPISPNALKIMGEFPISIKSILYNKRPVQKQQTTKEMAKMTYDQIVAYSKNRYMDPFADADKDGVVNLADCRPLNKHKQHVQLASDEYDIKGNLRQLKEIKIRDEDKNLPIKNAKRTVEVEVKEQEIETEED